MKSRIQSMMKTYVALLCVAFASCTDDALVETSQKYAGKFELTVTQDNPDSRLALNQDGLTTQWEPGDKLVLVDKTRTLAPIFLNCTLDEPASSATFMAESGVPAGDYYVIYNYNENLVYGHKMFQSVDDINSHDDLVLWNELKILEGEDHASISLQHLYAKIRVELKNVSGASGTGYHIGMYSSKRGFPVYKQFTGNGLVDAEYGVNTNSMTGVYNSTYIPSNRKYHNIPFGYYSPEWIGDAESMIADYSKAAQLSALVLPADLSEEEIFFYVIYGNTCYEFKKAGIDLKAGTSYKVVLDMADEDVVVSTLNNYQDNETYLSVYQLTNVADWRHAAYRNSRGDMYGSSPYGATPCYEITQNIDFSDEYFFPIATYSIIGNGNTLSNIELDWSDEDNVGLTRHEWSITNDNREFLNVQLINSSTKVSDLILENVNYKGKNYVGAFGGYNINATNCEVIGDSSVEGSGNYVGGIVGLNRMSGSDWVLKLEDVHVGQSCSIRGVNYVGGIVGQIGEVNYWGSSIQTNSSILLLESCKSEAAVSATEDYVGGIFGKLGGCCYQNFSQSSSIEFSMEDYTFSLIKCVNEGSVTGRHYVGGIGGEFAVTSNSSGSALDRVVLSQSCSIGNVTGDSKVGGILGSSMAATNICYSIGEISASTSDVGGIVGNITMGGYQGRIANCYSLATISGTNTNIGGIIGNAGGGAMGTTIVNSYYAADPAVYSYGGIVGYSGGSTSVINCLTTLNSLGTNLGDHQISTGADYNGDGYPDYDYNGDGLYDSNDLYMNVPDNVTNSISAVTSILANIAIINGDNAYSSNTWSNYQWDCVKFASFSADTNSPDFGNATWN